MLSIKLAGIYFMFDGFFSYIIYNSKRKKTEFWQSGRKQLLMEHLPRFARIGLGATLFLLPL